MIKEEMPNARFEKILLLLILLTALVYLFTLGGYSLIDPDEGRYAEVAREMVETGDYITPHLNYVKFFDKPALPYWLTSISFHLFGINEFATRLSPALLALLGMFYLYKLASIIYNKRAGLITSLIIGTSLLYFLISHITITDMPLAFFITLSLSGFYIGYIERSRDYLLFYCGMALALLSKGLIGIIFPCGIIFWWSIFTKKWEIYKEVITLKSIMLFFAIALPWFIIVCYKNPDFFHYFFVRQHFIRYLTTADNRYEPFWFFIPIIILGFLPWAGFIWTSFKESFLLLWTPPSKQKDSELFLLMWFMFIFLFFSASKSKLVPYIIPVFSPLAVLVGGKIDSILSKKETLKFKTALIWNSLFLFTFSTLLLSLSFIQRDYLLGEILPISLSLFLAIGIGVFSLFIFYKKGKLKEVIIILTILGITNCIASHFFLNIYAEKHTSKYVATFINYQKKPGDLIVQLKGFDQGLPFYLQERVILLSHSNDMSFGNEHETNRFYFINTENLKKLWNSNKRIFIVAYVSQKEEIKSISGRKVEPLIVIGNKCIYSNKPFSMKGVTQGV